MIRKILLVGALAFCSVAVAASNERPVTTNERLALERLTETYQAIQRAHEQLAEAEKKFDGDLAGVVSEARGRLGLPATAQLDLEAACKRGVWVEIAALTSQEKKP